MTADGQLLRSAVGLHDDLVGVGRRRHRLVAPADGGQQMAARLGQPGLVVGVDGQQPLPFFYPVAHLLVMNDPYGVVNRVALLLAPAAKPHAGQPYLAGVNLMTLLLYGCDKRQAAVGGFRVPELVLHLGALAGGSPAALLGQGLFRHKTRKFRFQIVFAAIILLQMAAVGAYWYFVHGR